MVPDPPLLLCFVVARVFLPSPADGPAIPGMAGFVNQDLEFSDASSLDHVSSMSKRPHTIDAQGGSFRPQKTQTLSSLFGGYRESERGSWKKLKPYHGFKGMLCEKSIVHEDFRRGMLENLCCVQECSCN
jgi:hypothetical protein